MRKVICIRLFLFFYVVILFTVFNVCALDIPSVGDEIKLTECELNESYIKWEKLSAKEKEKTNMPQKCKVNNVKNIKRGKNFFLLGSSEDELPTLYDGRVQNYIVKNQYDTNSCWAFSSTSAIEYYANKNLGLNSTFSTRHIVYSTTREFLNNAINSYGYNKEPKTGGNYLMSSSYFTNLQGPVLESDMPFENNGDTISISEIQNKTVQLDVNDIVLEYNNVFGNTCTATQIKNIKEYIYNYGSVAISTYIKNDSNYYNSNTNAFYYNGTEDANHAVLLVGWDDDYSKNNFSTKPSENGAWIVQNSYGSSFGDNGYYYISYEDVHVCDVYMVIKNADKEVEDNSYVYDTLGYNTFYGFKYGDISYNSAYAMNVFTKNQNTIEEIKEITFGSSGVGTYKIYYTEGNGKSTSISNMQLIGSGTLENAGYVTHTLKSPIILDDSVTEFSIAVSYEMEQNNTMPLVVSSKDDLYYKYVSIENNKSYASLDGATWQDLASFSNEPLIASIKVFTDNVIEELDSNINNEYDNDILVLYEKLKLSAKNYIQNTTIDEEVYFEFSDGVINKVDQYGNTIQDENMAIDSNIIGSGEIRINSSNEISIVIYQDTKNIKNDYGSDKLYDEVLKYSRENVELFKNIHRLELLAEQYSSGNTLSSEWLVFFYIRQFKYSGTLYDFVTGKDANFIEYVNNNATNLKTYFEGKEKYTINEHEIDLKHMAASIAGILYDSPTIPAFMDPYKYEELEYDSVVSWAGDLHTLMQQSILKDGVKEQYGDYSEATYRLMGTGSFSMEDVYADIDAWLLCYNIKDNSELSLLEIFDEYYTGNSERSYINRFTSFVDVMNDIAADFTTNLVNFEGVANHFTNVDKFKPTIGTLDMTPTVEEQQQISAGFVKWIYEQKKLETAITSDVYIIDEEKLLIYVQPKTTIDSFKANVNGIRTFETNGKEYVYTGLRVNDYVVIVLGDVTGDGCAKMNDVMLISGYIVNNTGITDSYYLQAADVNSDKLIKMNDVMRISKYIVEGGAL